MRDDATTRAGGEIGPYYDRLKLWTALARPFGFGGGSAQLTVHRLLADPLAGGTPTASRLHDVIADALPPLRDPRILDAGCGLGGTMLDLVRRYGGTAVGLTLSDGQRVRAVSAAARRGMSERITVHLQSYDSPPGGPFDLIVAIESLAHSPDPLRSVTALARVLAPGGRLVVVDDMPEEGASGTADLDRFRKGWQAPVLWSRRDYVDAFARLGLSPVSERDLSGESRVRTLPQIERMERWNRIARAWAPQRWHVVLDSYYGGLALERLYRRGLMKYRLLVVSS